MTDIMDEDDAHDATDEAKQPVGSLDAQQTELDEVRQQVAANDEKTDTLQVGAPGNKRKWYREPSVLVSTLALVVSISTTIVDQTNVTSDRQIQERNRLTTLIEQLPIAQAEIQARPGLNDLVDWSLAVRLVVDACQAGEQRPC
jgi:hypothetical protein